MRKRVSPKPSTLGCVIIVDDDAAVRNSLKFALEQEGLNVRLYRDGKELLAEPELPPRGCFVIDYAMPDIDGIDLLDRLRQRHVKLPAILIIARATSDVRIRAARAGFRQVLEKPLEDAALVDGILVALASQTGVVAPP